MVTNGIDWSGDGRTLYLVVSAQRRIWAYDLNMDLGHPGVRRLFAEVGIETGYPDGLTVTRYRPEGSVQRVVSLPVPRTTSCCFRGLDLTALFLTSAKIGLDDTALGVALLWGGVFTITGLGVRDRRPHRFLG